MNHYDFEKKIKAYIKHEGRSQAAVARLLGYSQGTFNKWVNGVNRMPDTVIYELCKLLELDNIQQAELLNLAGYATPPSITVVDSTELQEEKLVSPNKQIEQDISSVEFEKSHIVDPKPEITNIDTLKQERLLSVFLCHSSDDKDKVRDLYTNLVKNGIDAWLDEEKLLPGQDWQHEIRKAVQKSDFVIICLSRSSINKQGFIQKELRFALDIADEQPFGTIFLIPLKLEECEIPDRLRHLQTVDYFHPRGYERLLEALQTKAKSLRAQQPGKTKNWSDWLKQQNLIWWIPAMLTLLAAIAGIAADGTSVFDRWFNPTQEATTTSSRMAGPSATLTTIITSTQVTVPVFPQKFVTSNINIYRQIVGQETWIDSSKKRFQGTVWTFDVDGRFTFNPSDSRDDVYPLKGTYSQQGNIVTFSAYSKATIVPTGTAVGEISGQIDFSKDRPVVVMKWLNTTSSDATINNSRFYARDVSLYEITATLVITQ